jgi:hypothetical protein
MRISKLANDVWKYLSVLAVLVATGIGVLMGRDLYPVSLASGSQTPTLLSAEPDGLQPLLVLGEPGTCLSSLIFLSLPPKCKTLDGSFVQAGGPSPYVILIPQGK